MELADSITILVNLCSRLNLIISDHFYSPTFLPFFIFFHIALVLWWNSAKLIRMDPDQPDQTQTQTPIQQEPVVSEPTPVVENPQPIPPPEIPSPESIIIPPVDVPIPNFRFPFNGNFPVTFSFNASPTTDEMKTKFLQWGISGHHGIDFGLPEGTEILAVDSGKIILSGDNGDYGNCVTIQHPWGKSLYAHLKETKVSENQEVKTGDLIGISGQTGAAFGPHLHFGIKPNNPNESNGYLGFIDPTQYLPQTPQNPQPIVPEPEKPKEEVKPEEPKPIIETPAPVIPSPPPPNPLPAEAEAKVGPQPVIDDSEIQKRAEEMLKNQQQAFRVLGNQAKTQQHEENIKKIIVYAQEKKQIDNQQVRDLLHVSQSTATNYLTELVNKGVLRIEGEAKATVYLY